MFFTCRTWGLPPADTGLVGAGALQYSPTQEDICTAQLSPYRPSGVLHRKAPYSPSASLSARHWGHLPLTLLPQIPVLGGGGSSGSIQGWHRLENAGRGHIFPNRLLPCTVWALQRHKPILHVHACCACVHVCTCECAAWFYAWPCSTSILPLSLPPSSLHPPLSVSQEQLTRQSKASFSCLLPAENGPEPPGLVEVQEAADPTEHDWKQRQV